MAKKRTLKQIAEDAGKCYCLLSGEYDDILKHKNDSDWILYPERSLTLRQKIGWIPPPGVNVITECPQIITTYTRGKVYVKDVDSNDWEECSTTVYGTTWDRVYQICFNIKHDISSLPLMELTGLIRGAKMEEFIWE